MNTQTIPRAGQRIEMILMRFDVTPVAPGTRGTVLRVDKWGTQAAYNVQVAWDTGGGLAICTDQDEYRIITNET